MFYFSIIDLMEVRNIQKRETVRWRLRKVPLDELVAKFPLFPDSDPAPHSVSFCTVASSLQLYTYTFTLLG